MAVPGPRAVHLPKRSSRERLRFEFLERLLRVTSQFVAKLNANQSRVHRWRTHLKVRQLIDGLFVEQMRLHAEHLAQFHGGPAQFLQFLPNPLRIPGLHRRAPRAAPPCRREKIANQVSHIAPEDPGGEFRHTRCALPTIGFRSLHFHSQPPFRRKRVATTSERSKSAKVFCLPCDMSCSQKVTIPM